MNLKGGAVIFGTGKWSLTWQVEVYVRRRRGGDAGSVVIQSLITRSRFCLPGQSTQYVQLSGLGAAAYVLYSSIVHLAVHCIVQ